MDAKLLHILIPQKLLKRIDDFRFKHRYESRAEAVRYLLSWALDKHDKGDK